MKILLEDDSLRIKMGSSGYNHVAKLLKRNFQNFSENKKLKNKVDTAKGY